MLLLWKGGSMKALVIGATGQDGSYLTELLLSKGYIVHAMIRRSSVINTERIDHLYDNPNLHRHYGDVADMGSMLDLVYNVQPDEIYNLAAMSHVRLSFDMPEYTGDVTGLGVTRLLEAVKRSGIKTRVYQASSSELFGCQPPTQSELTPFMPASPYGCAKLYAHWMAVNYRKAYGMHVSCGILFNHESPRRGEVFVSRKIAKGLAAIVKGEQDKLILGNLDAYRDWGYAPDFVEMMWRMMQEDKPDDYVVGTGESHSVYEFLTTAAHYVGIDGRDLGALVEVGDKRYIRPIEVDHLRADAKKARERLGWEPKTTFNELVKIMIDAEMAS
jgi:GDPmannose 4,6-dehydratase